MIKLLVFDFDGTLADTKDVVSGVLLNILKQKKYNISSEIISKNIGRAPIGKTLEHIGVKREDIGEIEQLYFMQMKPKMHHIKPAGNIDILDKINSSKIIISNNTNELIEIVLKSWKKNSFKEVFGTDGVSSKVGIFKKATEKYKVQGKEIAYFGDLDLDVRLAKEVGCHSVAVSNKYSWGTRAELIKAKQDFLIKDWNEVHHLIEKLNQI